jgi:ATP-dependent protease HslVU (ClpYQ) peptidase subunit
MPKEDVERFVGLLVSDDVFAKEVTKDFDRAVSARNIALDKREQIVLKEGIDTYLRPRAGRAAIGRGGTVAVPAAAAVGAAVAGAVAAEVATKVVDKLMDSKFVNPINERLREAIISRGVLTKRDFAIR